MRGHGGEGPSRSPTAQHGVVLDTGSSRRLERPCTPVTSRVLWLGASRSAIFEPRTCEVKLKTCAGGWWHSPACLGWFDLSSRFVSTARCGNPQRIAKQVGDEDGLFVGAGQYRPRGVRKSGVIFLREVHTSSRVALAEEVRTHRLSSAVALRSGWGGARHDICCRGMSGLVGGVSCCDSPHRHRNLSISSSS